MLATEATVTVWVVGADLQDVFEQEAFPLQRAATHLTDKTLGRSRTLPLVSDNKWRPSSLLLPWRSHSWNLFCPVTVWIWIAGDG